MSVSTVLAAPTSPVGRSTDAGIRQMTDGLAPEELQRLEEFRTKYAAQREFYTRLEAILRRSRYPQLVSQDNPEGRETVKLGRGAHLSSPKRRLDSLELHFRPTKNS